MQALTIQVNQNAQPAVYTPKLNYAFYKQVNKDEDLKGNNQGGFSALINGLLDGNVDMIVATYYHSLAYYKRNQPSEDAVEAALESTVFASDDDTSKAFDEIIEDMKQNDFLARKLSEFIKSNDKLSSTMEKHIASMTDEDKKDQYQIGMEQVQETTNKLQSLLTTQESSSKPEE